MRRLALALVAAVVLVLAGCGGDDDAGTAASPTPTEASAPELSGEVVVLAAASLTETFETLGDEFEASHPGVTVTYSFGPSSGLAAQILQGAPADVFAAANTSTMQQVVDGDLASEPTIFVRNVLAIAVPPDNPAGIEELADIADPAVVLALCADEVPCGSAAQQVLTAAGLTVVPDTYEQDVKAVLTKVTLGEVDAGLVYRTDVAAAGDDVVGIDFPEAEDAVNDYPIVALDEAPNAEAALAFVDFILSPEAATVFEEAGFALP
jgi:molybdate transport system substrate-binding protein